MSEFVFYAAYPYAAFIVAIAAGLHRYFRDRFSYSSFSSQFLENRWLFWGSAPWHYAILIVLLAHLVPILVPGAWMAFVGEPVRLYAIEASGLALGFLVVAGTAVLIARRLLVPKARAVTSVMDWVLLAALLLQAATGVYIAIVHRWGAAWYASTAVPWFRSLLVLAPEPGFVTPLPGVVKLHIVTAFAIVALFPFTRLVHIVTVPLGYLWRPYQVFAWYRRGRMGAGGAP
jgi:nitrate reductase gamma subunit